MVTMPSVFYRFPLFLKIKVYSADCTLTPKMQLVVNSKGKRLHYSTSVLAFSEAQMTDTPAFLFNSEDSEPALGMADQCT